MDTDPFLSFAAPSSFVAFHADSEESANAMADAAREILASVLRSVFHGALDGSVDAEITREIPKSRGAFVGVADLNHRARICRRCRCKLEPKPNELWCEQCSSEFEP